MRSGYEISLFQSYAKSFAYKYSGVINAINDILHGKDASLETSKPLSLIGGRGLYKGKGRSGVSC